MIVLTQALHYLRFYPWRTALIILSLSLCISVPLSIQRLVHDYETQLHQRANSTPLILGATGNRYDLAMNALYFRASHAGHITLADNNAINETKLALGIPLYVRYTASGYPVVGTNGDYVDFRQLALATGTGLAFVGDAVLGANVARTLGVSVGDQVLTDQKNLYNLAAAYPVKLNVVGVLAPVNTVDDNAIFCGVKTTWIIEGLGHGHDNVKSKDALSRQDNHTVAGASIRTHIEITPENRNSFHFHGDPEDFPLSAVIVAPPSAKKAALLKARYNQTSTRVLLNPNHVVQDIMSVVVRFEQFTQQAVALVLGAMILVLALLVSIVARLRQEETRTLAHIGYDTWHIRAIYCAEWGVMILLSVILSFFLMGAILPWIQGGLFHA